MMIHMTGTTTFVVARLPRHFCWRAFFQLFVGLSCATATHKFTEFKPHQRTMPAASTVVNDSQPADSSTRGSHDGTVPSGFILKLFQMVNGAPDDMITWTTNGDAFKIGSDLNKFESETLPQYFRHSRFQSLVRQLNFYNFRKVNRERTFWVYKHDLFHRDRPEDLHLLRRRTCPGVDGRKNRFSSRASENGEETFTTQSASSEESSLGGGFSSGDDDTEPKSRRSKKRRAVSSVSNSKRSRRGLGGEDIVGEDDVHSSLVVSMRGRAPGHLQNAPRNTEVAVQDGCVPEKAGRTEMMEQSLIVSQVAMKLEEYARKAKKATLVRGGRTRGGVVTPPPGSAFDRGLLTYDDEFDSEEHSPSGKRESSGSNSSLSTAVITDGDDSLHSEDDPASAFEANIVSESNSPVRAGSRTTLFGGPPITDLDTVKGVVEKMTASANGVNNEFASASAAVIAFCMTTAPTSSKGDLCSKVLHLISSTDKLASEFQQYRAALHPLECSKDMLPSFMFAASYRKNHDISVQQIWQRDVSRIDAVRDFKTFAVNYFHEVLLQKPSKLFFTESEVSALRYAADVWLRSACDSF